MDTLYGQDRRSLRDIFFRAWRKHLHRQPLEGVETRVVAVAEQHPEYHTLLADPESGADHDWPPELGQTNPFLHLALHIAIDEQLAVDRPPGVRTQYLRLRAASPDDHAAQHRMMDCLGEVLWQAQRRGQPPSESDYLDCLTRLAPR